MSKRLVVKALRSRDCRKIEGKGRMRSGVARAVSIQPLFRVMAKSAREWSGRFNDTWLACRRDGCSDQLYGQL